MNDALITIGVTCYNAEKTIKRAIDSALAQDWVNIELLIVDDCSSDDSIQIIESVIDNRPKARLVRHPDNRGPAVARNTLLAEAQGDIVVFFDDDDESHPTRVRKQYELLSAYEASIGSRLVACYASGVRRYPNGYELAMPAIGSRPEIPQGEAVVDYLLLNKRSTGMFFGAGVPTCALMARVDVFSSVGGFDPGLRRVEDLDFAIGLALSGGHFIGTSQALFTQLATTGTDKTPRINLDAELYLIDKYRAYLDRKGMYSYARDWFKLRYYHFSKQHFRFALGIGIFILSHPIEGGRHIARSVPARWLHERKMREKLGDRL